MIKNKETIMKPKSRQSKKIPKDSIQYDHNLEVDINDVKIINKEECDQFITFWRPTDQYAWLGQWYKSDFYLTPEIIEEFPKEIMSLDLFNDKYDTLEKLLQQESYNTAEKFMMMGKAALFGDDVIFEKMSSTISPSEHKSLGQKVKNFDENIWKMYSRDIVKIGNYLKFSQNTDLKDKLLGTHSAELVEGSPCDRIWGVGMRFDNPLINDKSNWKGLNYLGECIMYVRDILQ